MFLTPLFVIHEIKLHADRIGEDQLMHYDVARNQIFDISDDFIFTLTLSSHKRDF